MAEHPVKPQYKYAFKGLIRRMSIENFLRQCFSHLYIIEIFINGSKYTKGNGEQGTGNGEEIAKNVVRNLSLIVSRGEPSPYGLG